MFFFFFQAEDGIRDVAVTGVQTCALPILPDALKKKILDSPAKMKKAAMKMKKESMAMLKKSAMMMKKAAAMKMKMKKK